MSELVEGRGRFKVYTAVERKGKTYWIHIGWADGVSGELHVSLDAIPANGRLVIREDEPAPGEKLTRNRRRTSRRGR